MVEVQVLELDFMFAACTPWGKRLTFPPSYSLLERMLD